jgi:hypothetical protein
VILALPRQAIANYAASVVAASVLNRSVQDLAAPITLTTGRAVPMSKPAAAFWIRESQTGHGLRLSLTGELDLVTTPIPEVHSVSPPVASSSAAGSERSLTPRLSMVVG